MLSHLTTKTAIAADPCDGHKIVLLGLVITADANANVLIESGNTALSGTIEVLADTPFVLAPQHAMPWLECAASEALSLTSDAALNGWAQYAVIKA